MVHDLSPYIWRITGDLGIHWFGVTYLVAFVCFILIISWMSRRQRMGLTPEMIFDLVIFGSIGALIGGRLGYCLFYSPDLFLKFRGDFPFWGVLAVNEGGMSTHGGIVGLGVALVFFSIRSGLSQLYLFDVAALVGSLGIFFGRVASFINGELVGRVADASYPLAMKFPQDILFWPQYDRQKLSSLENVITQVPQINSAMSKDEWLRLIAETPSTESARTKIDWVLTQIIESIQSGNEAVKNAVAPLLPFRHPWTLYAAVGEGLFIFLCLFAIWYKPRRPGIVAAWFVVLYSVIRIVDEQFRQPDPQLGLRWFDLTQGQWLSGIMLLVGIWWMVIFIGRRETIPSPGWGLGPNVRIHRRI